MIKRLIFDLDNTLIMWRDEYNLVLKETLDYFHIDNVDYNILENYIDTKFELSYDKYTYQNMIDFINKKFNLNINQEFMDMFQTKIGKCASVDDEVIETLEYLSKKYELVILTNWFKEVQVKRMKEANIFSYFKEIYGGDKYIKPNPNSYKIACDSKKIDECIMIGDSYDIDIKGAININMKAILLDKKNKYVSSDKYKVIKKISDLKELL